ncbi:hypothetical protein [Legionella hackeliae]|nr:hypothetical protein [Legionella hackeliae]
MKTKTEPEDNNFFDNLPNETMNIIVKALDDEPIAQRNFNLSCRFFYNNYNEQWFMQQLINAVVSGNQDKAQKILQHYPQWMIEKINTINDLSGRSFHNLSLWQYTLWALDVRYMAPMMLQSLPQNAQGEKIRLQLDKQFEAVEVDGVTYELAGNTYYETEYDFDVIWALLKYIADKNKDVKTCSLIGQAQRLVPAHVAQHFCNSEEPFQSTSSFKKEQFKRTLRFYNSISEKFEHWFSSQLGLSFAIVGGTPLGAVAYPIISKRTAENELEALRTLRKRRTKDLIILKKQLQNPIEKQESDLGIKPA